MFVIFLSCIYINSCISCCTLGVQKSDHLGIFLYPVYMSVYLGISWSGLLYSNNKERKIIIF